MSGFLNEVATPCPRRLGSSSFGGRDSGRSGSSLDSLCEDMSGDSDDTKNIDFTTEIRAPVLTGAKPRRRNKTSTSFMIHTDAEKKPIDTTIGSKKEARSAVGPSNRKTSLLAQPAQRFRPRVSFAPSPPRHSQQKRGVDKRKLGTNPDPEKNKQLLLQINGGENMDRPKDILKKDICRDRVHIPPDETTVASGFMGLFSPLKSNNIRQNMEKPTGFEPLESQVTRERRPKHSLPLSPQRAPLQPSSRIIQDSCTKMDIAGKNGGKENIPPGAVIINNNNKKIGPTKPITVIDDRPNISKLQADICRGPRSSGNVVSRPLASKIVNGPVQRTLGVNRLGTKVSSTVSHRGAETRKGLNSRNGAASIRPSIRSKSFQSSTAALTTSVSRSTLKNSNSDYPLISENITDPAMYDDNWLSHQEVILTQLINGLFNHTTEDHTFNDPTILRQEFLKIYQSASFTNLYKRIQASLLYGALSIPDVLVRNSRLRQDLGMKRKFFDFWLQTYDMRVLRAAMEAVTGRQMPDSRVSPNITASCSQAKEKPLKKRLELFLDVFLVQNQDMDRHPSKLDGDAQGLFGKEYHRTVLRSMMLVILLDKAKSSHAKSLPGTLFLNSSPYKSSAAVLQALARFLIPSSGDVLKALGQLGYQLLYTQNPLAEYEYEINNLAVDFRDGVRLTRIVELLLYPTASCVYEGGLDLSQRSQTLSEGTFEDDRWPVSQHLKFPCLSRTVKIFNVNIALNSLTLAEGATTLVSQVRAEDLVDGHREKTIALLWGLVSKWGLAGLIDVVDVRKEIDRLTAKVVFQTGSESIDDGVGVFGPSGSLDSSDDPTKLLKKWAFLVAQLKGLRVENLTTSFCDGRVYESIVHEYEEIIGGISQSSQTSGLSLRSRLQALGCNSEFVNLVCPNISQVNILNSDFTIGVLAFLCSRLLSATKRVRAANVLQNAWRRVLVQRDLQRRVVAREVARQCAAVVQTRNQILWAKGVIVQWWRRTKARQRQRKTALARKSSKVPLRRYRK